MRKLFRFKYEPCNGTCYAWCDALPEELLRLTEADRRLVVSRMVEAHAKLCDNPNYSFGVDLHEAQPRVFVAHFRTPESTETFVGTSFHDCVSRVCSRVMEANIPQVTGECNFGNHGSEDLGAEILRACVDLTYREEHHKACPCQKVA